VSFRSRRLARRLASKFWFVPSLYVLVSLVCSFLLVRWDELDPIELVRSMDPDSATSALSALASGMLVFTGFVTSVSLMVVQFGTSEFSPRFVAWLHRDQTLKYALSTFTATFLFALMSTALVGAGNQLFVPTRTMVAALLLTLLSVFMFLMLIERTSNGLRVANVVHRVDREARKVFDTVYTAGRSEAASGEEAIRLLHGAEPIQVIRQGEVGSVLLSLDLRTLRRLAEEHDAVIEFHAAVGDHVSADGVLLEVYGDREISERRLRSAIFTGDERTLLDDPAFAIRMLVDVAIKALSPAVNDPTTAVQVIDRIEDLLRYASSKHLSAGFATDSGGTIRVIYRTPTWDDLVELALVEIRAFGAGQYQITRRMFALFDSLLQDLPAKRHPQIVKQQRLLTEAIEAALPPSQRAEAFVSDRQGLGLASRRARADGI
jgi:uncharacterized membrane protein